MAVLNFNYYRDSVDKIDLAALSKEASLLKSSRVRIKGDSCSRGHTGALGGRTQKWSIGPGSQLTRFHSKTGRKQADKLYKLMGEQKLAPIPTRSSYIYYDVGDFSFLHNDAASAQVTSIIGLSDRLLPLLVFPNLSSISEVDICRLNNFSAEDLHLGSFLEKMVALFGDAGKCLPVKIDKGDIVTFPGHRFAHARAKQQSEGCVATLCYSVVNPPVSWRLPS